MFLLSLFQVLRGSAKYPIKRQSWPKSDANAQKYSVSDNFIDLGYTQRNIWTFLYSKQSCQNHQILNKYQLRLFVSKLETPSMHVYSSPKSKIDQGHQEESLFLISNLLYQISGQVPLDTCKPWLMKVNEA